MKSTFILLLFLQFTFVSFAQTKQPVQIPDPGFSDETLARLTANLEKAKHQLAGDPDNVELMIWAGRRLGYLWQYHQAIDLFTEAINKNSNYAPAYRHRGHRYISIREFDLAIADLTKAATLVEGEEDIIEQDGAPNAAGIPTSTLQTNIWYHLALAYYLKGDYEKAKPAWEKCLSLSKSNDMWIATADWLYMTLRRLGENEAANKLIEPVTENMEIIENFAYHKRVLMYKGLISSDELLAEDASDLDLATQGYGLANWHYYNGNIEYARVLMRKVVKGKYWPAFGFIASEADLFRLMQQGEFDE